MAAFKWTDELVEELITLYEGYPCLYNVKLKEYSNRDKRKQATRNISSTLGCSGEPWLVTYNNINYYYVTIYGIINMK